MNTILHSKIIGEGQPFVILHGFLGMGDNWKTLGKRFSQLGYQVHLVDQRNHGRSFHDPEFNYEIMAADLKIYADYHNLDEIILLGHSMGGKTAMEFATAHSGDVNKLIVADIAPKAYPLHHQDILKALSSLDFSQVKSRGEVEELLSVYIKQAGTRLFLMKNLYWREKGQLDLRINLPVLKENIAEIGIALDPAKQYTGTTLFVRGGESGYIDGMDELTIPKQFPNSTLATIEGAGHWLHADKPAEFYEEIVSFLN